MDVVAHVAAPHRAATHAILDPLAHGCAAALIDPIVNQQLGLRGAAAESGLAPTDPIRHVVSVVAAVRDREERCDYPKDIHVPSFDIFLRIINVGPGQKWFKQYD